MEKPVIGFIGAGRVGRALATVCWRSGYRIGGIASRTLQHAADLAKAVGSAALPVDEVAGHCDLLFLTVPDDAIETIARRLPLDALVGRGVVHTSGVYSLDVLSSLHERGVMVGGLHPAYPISSEAEISGLDGVTFASESSDVLLGQWLSDLIVASGGREIRIPTGYKARYHAALVIASNFTVTLYAVAENLLMSVGASRDDADAVLNALVAGTVDNLIKQGIPAALTGPMVRGDTGTIRAHLASFDDALMREVYRGLVRLSYPMLIQRGVDINTIDDNLRDQL
jgi:predicted short-subunit dehydrogenase-like oxidoreductase (DUF2520 family)